MGAEVNENQSGSPAAQGPGVPESAGTQADLADQSLADALRISFRVLTVIMICVLIAFLLTGVKIVDSTQRGIETLFGAIVGTSEPGPVFTYPYPVGGIELVEVKEKTLNIDDFWMHETPEDKTKELGARKPGSEGLRPGWDGALITGDRYLLHVRLTCKYEIANVEQWKMNVSDEAETIRSAVCNAAIKAAAARTGDSLQRLQKREFLNDIQVWSQQALGRLNAGIRIKAIEVPLNGMTFPLRTLRAFNEVIRARTQMESLINEARGEAEDILNAAAGEDYRKLVGEPWRISQVLTNPEAKSEEDYDLIGKYEAALREHPTDQSERLLGKIEEVLLTTAAGNVARTISEARGYSTQIEQRVKSYADRFRELNEQLPQDPQGRKLMLQRLWADVRDEILNSPTLEIISLPLGGGQTVLIVPRDQQIRKQVLYRERRGVKEKKPSE